MGKLYKNPWSDYILDIRDRFGKTQVILSSDELIEIGKTLSNEDVIHVSGKVSEKRFNQS